MLDPDPVHAEARLGVNTEALLSRARAFLSGVGAIMTSFDERLRAFEAKFAADEALQFRVRARRDHLLGLWAGRLMGKSGTALEVYAMAIVTADLSKEGEAELVAKLEADFKAAGLALGAPQIIAEMTSLWAVAKQQIMKGQ